MKKLLLWLIAGLMLVGYTSSAWALSKKKKKEKSKTEKKSETPKKKSVYDKLFKDSTKHTVHKGAFTIHQYDDKIYLELPVLLMGRDFLVNSIITNTSDIALSGTKAAKSRYLIIEKTDSLVLFRDPKYNIRLNENESNQKQAFALSRNHAIYKAFSIEGYTSDSTAIVFDATSYFSNSSKDILDLAGRSYGGMLNITSASPKSKTSFIESTDAFNSCISVTQSCSAKLTISIMGFISTDQPELTMSLQTTLALLPENKMPTREANPHVGTGYIAYNDFRNDKRSKEGYYTTRRTITPQQPITFYVDTLIQESWVKAIQRSADEWNVIFEGLGMGNPIQLKPYAKDSTFRAIDPMLNTISFLNNSNSEVTSYNMTDLRTGEILSTKMGVPRDFAFSVRRNGVYQMAEVDSRFRTYFIPDDAICEVLTARMLKAFGLSMGLTTNLAGSAAYSPQELRSPEFTQKYGITASVMDEVLYNYLARPGDKEKGVALIVNKPGICDAFALKYLYTAIQDKDESETLNKWVMEHDGDPRYFYGKRTSGFLADPRCQSYDLGNDPIAAFDAQINRIKYVVANSPAWYRDDNIPTIYRELFPDFTIIELANKTLTPISSYIGGIYLNEANAQSDVPSYQSVPAATQKKIVKKILSTFEDLSWLDNNPAFLLMGGANPEMSTWIYNNGMPMSTLMLRLMRMGLSVEKSAAPYTQTAYLNDLEDYLFKETRSGKALSANKMTQLSNYIAYLKSMSPTLKAIDKTVSKGASSVTLNNMDDKMQKLLMQHMSLDGQQEFGEHSGMEATTSAAYYQGTDIEAICYDKLKNTRRNLMQARTKARNDIERGKCDYLIAMIDRVL